MITELTDLPNYREAFTEPLAGIGVTDIEELRQVLTDEERTAAMISAVRGLGPKIVQSWKDTLANSEEPTEAPAEEEETTPLEEETEVEEQVETAVVEEEVEEPEVDEPSPAPKDAEEPVRAKENRNLFCTLGDIKEIQRTVADLLKMNGSKKKGLTASVEYASKRLKGAGLDVTVVQESEAPVIVASKGEGGVVLWGHLDTDRLDGMRRREQGAVRGDMIHGRGAANMKGAVAAMLCAADRLASWQVPFSMVLTTDALGEQKGAEAVAKLPAVQNGRGVLILGPTGMRPVVGQAGYAAVKVRISGEGAVMKMVTFLEMLSCQVEESSGRLSAKVGMIRGGRKRRPFDPAQSCEVMMELETLDPTDSALKMVEELLLGYEFTTEVLCRSEMVEFDRSSELVQAVSDLTKKEPVFEMIHSEAAKIVPANPRVCICGPGSVDVALSDQEYVTLRDLERTFEAILSVVDWSAPLQG